MNDNRLELTSEVNRLSRQLTRLRIEQEIVERQLVLAQDNLEYEEVQSTKRESTYLHYQTSRNPTTKAKVKSERSVDKLNPRNLVVRRVKRELAYEEGDIPEIGDVISIINPKSGQQDQGVVEGH